MARQSSSRNSTKRSTSNTTTSSSGQRQAPATAATNLDENEKKRKKNWRVESRNPGLPLHVAGRQWLIHKRFTMHRYHLFVGDLHDPTFCLFFFLFFFLLFVCHCHWPISRRVRRHVRARIARQDRARAGREWSVFQWTHCLVRSTDRSHQRNGHTRSVSTRSHTDGLMVTRACMDAIVIHSFSHTHSLLLVCINASRLHDCARCLIGLASCCHCSSPSTVVQVLFCRRVTSTWRIRWAALPITFTTVPANSTHSSVRRQMN